MNERECEFCLKVLIECRDHPLVWLVCNDLLAVHSWQEIYEDVLPVLLLQEEVIVHAYEVRVMP